MIFLDFSAAFDILDHNLLLEKLEYYKFSPAALLWIKSYLNERQQTVYFNGSISETTQVKYGVPQGSCLGPLLYSIFTNDFPLVLKAAQIAMYEDDSTIYLAESMMENLNRNLNEEIATVMEWIESNQVILDVSKTMCMVIGSNYSLQSNPKLDLSVKNMFIKQVEEIKLLGVITDDKLSWDKHIQKIVMKMGNTLSMIKRCSKFLTQVIRKKVVQALALSHLDYGSIVWSNASHGIIRKLQIIQNKAARMALACGLRTNVTKMHENLLWMDVKNRSKYLLMVFMRNVIRTKRPMICYKKLSFSAGIHNFPTRHATGGCFTLPKFETAGQKTVMFRAMKE